MPEDFDDQPQEKPDGQKYWNLLLRRRWYLLVPFFLTWLAVYAISWVLPSVYRSGTLILVEESSLSKTMAGTPDNTDLQDRLDSIQQQVFSRTRLLRIIDHLNLYPKQRARMAPDDLVEMMRKDAQIELVRSPGKAELTSFNIYFSADNPYVAQQVTTELTNILISENLEVSQQNSENTTRFLSTQLETAGQNLKAQEEKVRVFKDQHLGELPEQNQNNLQILSGLQQQLQSEQDSLGRARQQSAYLQSMQSQYQGLKGIVRPAGTTTAVGLPALDQELDRLRAQLSDLSSRYTDQHPDVRKVKDQIAKTEKARQQMAADMKAKAADPKNAGPDYNDKDLPMIQAESELKANEIEIANRQHSIVALTAQINEYQARLNRAPVRVQELADLTRDYEQSRKDYESLLAKKNQSELATNLNKSEEGEHFRMIDPPSLPTKPYSPKRFQFSLGGLVAGLALGLGTVLAMDFLDKRIYDEKQFQEMIPAEILAEIPPLTTAAEESEKQRRVWLEWGAAAGLAFVMLLGVAFSYLRG
jgi:succinoglycan biosynthesis transport protein ExoP